MRFQILLLATLAASCGRQHSDPTAVVPKTYFTHGDPAKIVEGATMDTASFFTTTNKGTYDNYLLAGLVTFYEKSETGTATSAETGQEASTGATAAASYWSFASVSPDYLYKPDTVVDGQDFALKFAVSGATLSFTAVCGGATYTDCTDVTVLHYSTRKDGRAFSFMATYIDPDKGKALIGIYFSKPTSTAATKVDTKYKYLAGPGVVTKWKETLDVQICGSPGADRAAEYTSGVNSWLTSGKLSSTMKVNLTSTAVIKPFTDLVSHCITTIDDFFIEDQEDASVMGVTFATMDLGNGEILGGQILMMRTSSEKIVTAQETAKQATVRSSLSVLTAAHEFGHLIGLDHEFSKDSAGKQLYQSIMSYDTTTNLAAPAPQTHDTESIVAAYGAK